MLSVRCGGKPIQLQTNDLHNMKNMRPRVPCCACARASFAREMLNANLRFPHECRTRPQLMSRQNEAAGWCPDRVSKAAISSSLIGEFSKQERIYANSPSLLAALRSAMRWSFAPDPGAARRKTQLSKAAARHWSAAVGACSSSCHHDFPLYGECEVFG